MTKVFPKMFLRWNMWIAPDHFFRPTLLALLAGLACLVSGIVLGADTTGSLLFDESRMLRASDLKPGMKGYGLTVFQGTKPERFEAEVVGVRHHAFPGEDMILCKLSHPLLQDIGVVAGMSGSPVFIDGKLIGAVAYGWTFSKEPLAGVTPIEHMLRVLEATSENLRDPDDLTGKSQAFDAFSEMRRTLELRPLLPSAISPRSEWKKSEFTLSPQAAVTLPETFQLEPMAAPLFASFSSPLAMSALRAVCPSAPVYSLAGAGGSSVSVSQKPEANTTDANDGLTSALVAELQGGYALAVPLLEGDLALAGIGTITYRSGQKLLAFGHPMFEYGVVRYPMAAARIHSIVRNLARPFKLGESLGQIGTIRQDRLPAVGGMFGSHGRMFPIHVVVQDKEYRGRREFTYRAWSDKLWGPSLAIIALTESLGAAGRSAGETAVEFRYTIALDDGTSITKEDYFVDQYGGGTAGIAVGSELGMFTTNPYKRVSPARLDFHATLHARYPEAQLRALTAEKRVYRPGEVVRIFWELEPYRKPIEKGVHEFGLPPDLPDGDYELVVTNSVGREALDSQRNPATAQIRDYASLVEQIRRSFPRNSIYIVLLDSDTGSSVRGQELSRLPSSVISTLESTTEAGHYASVRGNFLLDERLLTSYEISGRERLTLKVRRSGRE
ncbi:MAG: SpoIVB peptidase S55 domain-containing protein [Candidatus Sumerlaeaceae bacterium]